MRSAQSDTTKHQLAISVILTALATLLCAVTTLNVAELQSAAMIVVDARASDASDRPEFDVGGAFIIATAMAPVLVLTLALFRRWSLVEYLAWLLAALMLVLVLSSAAVFSTYRYWRDHQAVSAVVSTPHSRLSRKSRAFVAVDAGTLPRKQTMIDLLWRSRCGADDLNALAERLV
jgi:hypothetical protein